MGLKGVKTRCVVRICGSKYLAGLAAKETGSAEAVRPIPYWVLLKLLS